MNGEVDGPEVTGGEPQAGAGRMWGLLQDLLDAHGREGTAALLGVNERTLRRAESNRHVTPQLQKELERHVEDSLSDGPSPQQLALEMTGLTSRFDGLERGTRESLDRLRQEMAELVAENVALKRRVDELEQHSSGGVGQRTTEGRGDSPDPMRTTRTALDRRYPQLVTEEAEPGEHAVYGTAMPLITEWRERRGAYLAHLDSADDWSKLRSELRMTELEIELIDAHVLTLPPSDYPWDGIRRHSELRLRRRTLERLRRERRRARVKRWLLRLVTLGWRGR
ncbi:MAG: hypothetical protein F4Y35_08520 [Chloroflexi bacterium]|nr:hypothetical protein [Chloroflexota bacterium]